ncbi:unnamed protein product [Ectocarpus fasciculatus]
MSNARFARPVWHLIDARDQVVGRLATQVAHVLRGKHKPTFTPHYDCGDVVVIVNAEKIHFSGNKVQDKKYQWHTGWVGGLKEINVADQLKKKPEEVIRRAVLGMLPKNKLRKRQALKLKIFPGDKHLHEDMLPPGTPSILG